MNSRPWRHRYAAPSFLAFLAFLGAYGISFAVFQKVSLNADEHSYLFQAYNFISGCIARPFPPYPDAFWHLMIILSPEAGWLSRYPFGHSLWLVPGVLLGDPYLSPALAAALTVFLVQRTGAHLLDELTGTVAAVLLGLSPMFLFYHGTLLSHSSALLATVVMLWAYVRWRGTDDLRFALTAGLAWGWLLNNRTYTALLIAIPFAVDSLTHLYLERSRRALIGTSCFALASVSGLLLLLGYNKLAVGDPWTMTYLFYAPSEALGFGSRHFGRIEHTFARGVEILGTQVELLNVWLLGFWGSLILCLGLMAAGWMRRWSPLFLGAILSVILGHIYFWYPGPRDAGPSYYTEILPFIVLGAAFGVRALSVRVPAWSLVLALLVWLPVDGVFMVKGGRSLHAMNEPRRQVADVLNSAPDGSLVFIKLMDHPLAFKDGNDMVFNPQGLESRILVARSQQTTDRALVHHFHDYQPLKLVNDGGEPRLVPYEDPLDARIRIGRMHRLTGTNIVHTEDPERLVRIAREGEHAPGLLAFGPYFYLYPGRFAMEFDVKSTPGVEGDPVMTLQVAADGARWVVAEEAVAECKTWETRRLEFELDEYVRIEPRVIFHGVGEGQIEAVRLLERKARAVVE